MEITRKFGQNKGNARIWIEGKSLESMGWTKGKRYDRYIDDEVITLTANPDGKLKVAGSEGRPILDLGGKWVTNWKGEADLAAITITEDSIIIERGFHE